MSFSPTSHWPARISAFVLAALAMAGAVAWGLKLRAAPGGSPVAVAAELPVQVDTQAVAQALGAASGHSGATPVSAQAPSSMVLLGVVADKGAHGTALVAVDGKPPKPFVVGATVGEGWVLAAVAPRRAVLRSSEGGVESVLELPTPPGLLVKTPDSPRQ